MKHTLEQENSEQASQIRTLTNALLAAYRWLDYSNMRDHIANPKLLDGDTKWADEYRIDVSDIHNGLKLIEKLERAARAKVEQP
jgi:hypothetical protein